MRHSLVLWVLLSMGFVPSDGGAQDVLLPDTFRDPATRLLLERARAARLRDVEGIESYEATLRQRIYVGLTALRFRRERGLFEHERIARIRWSADGERVIQWIGMRTAIPIVGFDTGGPSGPDEAGARVDSSEFDDYADDLIDATDMPGFDFDPGADRLTFGDDDWALHPLADSALAHYRYALGDTLRVALPANELSIVLYEVLVEPRRADFNLVAGSLWFDSLSASLVRATYRPARPFDLEIDEPEEARDVPGFLTPIQAEIAYVTVEYSLQELEFWLPRRYAFEGEARLGGLIRIPITFEWNVSGYLVNEAETDLLVEGELPEGWHRQENVEEDEDGNVTVYTVIVPTTRELLESPDLSEDFGERSPITFSDDEIEELAGKLQGLLPTYQRFRPRLAWGLEQGLVRFNRVEGLSVGTAAAVPLTPRLQLDATARIGLGDETPNISAALRWGPERSQWALEGYYRLESMSENGDAFSSVSSLMNILFGTDRGEYYRATGGQLGYRRWAGSVNVALTGFHERQRSVGPDVGSDFSVRGLFRDDLPVATVIPAEYRDVTGGRATLGWSSGADPNGLILTGSLGGEVGFGDASYQRASARLSASHPLPFRLAGAVEVAGGTSWGEASVQQSFFLGGAQTLRGFDLNEHLGQSFWRARAEIATGLPAARLSLFTDLGWVGDRSSFRLDDPLASVGLGASFLDGLVRLDVGRAVRGGSKWKVYMYLDGLF